MICPMDFRTPWWWQMSTPSDAQDISRIAVMEINFLLTPRNVLPKEQTAMVVNLAVGVVLSRGLK
jgi:hypothetical protein